MNINDFVIELPEIIYDAKKLKEIYNSSSAWTKRKTNTGDNKFYYRLSGKQVSENYYVREIAENFSNALNIDLSIDRIAEILQLPPHHGFDAHYDHIRTGVIIFPIIPDNPSPIYFAEGKINNPTKILYEHQYKCPTIINPQILHGVRPDHRFRENFQISILLPWDEILRLYQNNQLLNLKS